MTPHTRNHKWLRTNYHITLTQGVPLPFKVAQHDNCHHNNRVNWIGRPCRTRETTPLFALPLSLRFTHSFIFVL